METLSEPQMTSRNRPPSKENHAESFPQYMGYPTAGVPSAAEGDNPPSMADRYDPGAPEIKTKQKKNHVQPGAGLNYDQARRKAADNLQRMNALQKHASFFDSNNDGLISPLETYKGFRALGFNFIISLLAIFVINVPFSYVTQESWIPDPRLYIHLKNLKNAKHGSDSEVYDNNGNFDPQRFDDIFAPRAKTVKDHLTLREGLRLTESFRNPFDFFGWFASKLEFGLLFLLCGRRIDNHFVISLDHLRANYTGELFPKVSMERKEMIAARKQKKAR